MSTTPKIDDGGGAFPAPVEFDPNGQLISHGSYGMTLRDWFAGQETLSDCNEIPIQGLVALSGAKAPKFSDDPMAYFVWESNARAKLRYLRADAMIAARNKASQ